MLAIILASLGFGAVAVSADTLPPLPAEERLALPAVGFVRTKGPEKQVVCSGTLVAQDLVITSAHCTMKYVGLMNTVEFIAGRNGTRFIASSGAQEIIRHPVWSHAAGFGKHRYDIAVLRLARPIAAEYVAPISLLPENAPLPERAALVGYQNSPVKLLHGRYDCALNPTTKLGLMTSDCPASKGNSGGAVLTKRNNGWHLAGVIVAQEARTKSALLAELDDWLRGHVKDALKREQRRSARAN